MRCVVEAREATGAYDPWRRTVSVLTWCIVKHAANDPARRPAVVVLHEAVVDAEPRQQVFPIGLLEEAAGVAVDDRFDHDYAGQGGVESFHPTHGTDACTRSLSGWWGVDLRPPDGYAGGWRG